MTAIIDSDQHLYESRTCWRDNVDPALADEALRIEDDDLGYPWIMWRDRKLGVAEVQIPGETIEIGDRRRRCRAGEPPLYSYDDVLPVEYWDPAARRDHLTTMGLDGAVLFPNFGLLWERRLSESLPALLANMGAWNRWTATVAAEGKGALNPVAHVTLRDLDWLEAQLHDLAAAGVHMAMMAPALVDGKPLSHPDHDRAWSAFTGNGITPVFHVADQPRIFDDAWYTDDEEEDSPLNVMESAFLWTAAAVACTDLIVNGKLEQHPDLRIGIVELSSIWVPQFLMMLDGGYEFTAKLNGSVPAPLSGWRSEYFRRQVRVSSFSYEQPARLEKSAGDLFMCCSDYPHSEGTAAPIEDYKTQRCEPSEHAGLFAGNVEMLLGATG